MEAGQVMGRILAGCVFCRQIVTMAATSRGALLPVVPARDGTLAVPQAAGERPPVVRYLRGDDQPTGTEWRARSHWDWCPAAILRRSNARQKAAAKLATGKPAGKAAPKPETIPDVPAWEDELAAIRARRAARINAASVQNRA